MTTYPKSVSIDVNGRKVSRSVEPRTSLLDFLRDELHLTGVHCGCEHGVCGACTVLVNGDAVRSCLMLTVQAEGKQIETIECEAPSHSELSLIQDAFWEKHGLQCGFCTPAMILTARALLNRNSSPNRAEIREAISGNLCRCTGYLQIIESIELAAEWLAQSNRGGVEAQANSDGEIS